MPRKVVERAEEPHRRVFDPAGSHSYPPLSFDNLDYHRRRASKPTLNQHVRADGGIGVGSYGGGISSCAQILRDRKSTRLNSSHANISYDVFCLEKKE